jgi:alpha-mannosidase
MVVTYSEDMRVETYLSAGEPMLRFRVSFLPSGKRYRLRVVFPTTIRDGRIRHSIPFGHVERPEGEYAVQGWIDYADSEVGVCLLNRGLPGNNVTDGTLMLSLFRGIAMDDRDEDPWYEEGVTHTFEYALAPFARGDAGYNPERLASRYNRPVYTAWGRGRDAADREGIALKSRGAEVSCWRRLSEETFELRIYDGTGQGCDAEIRFPFEPASCMHTDAAGKAPEPVETKGQAVELSLAPFEVRTLRVQAP